MILTLEPKARLLNRVVEDNGCWIWVGAKSGSGYGKVFFTRKEYILAHRLSYQLFIGEIPKGLFICHKCDTPACVNPDHLFAGTAADNVADKVSKGRQGMGEKIKQSKLKPENIIAIRAEYKSGEMQRHIAKRHGVHFATNSDIITGKTWKHIPA
jgi:hypothetical protein